MRGGDRRSGSLFSYVDLEARVPAEHSLRALRQLGLVRYRKAGAIAYYKLDDDHISQLLAEGFRHIEEHG